MLILGIETSCDETAISVLETSDKSLHVRSNIISSQVKLHAKWGGVVPSLAAREHLKNIVPVLEKSLTEANISMRDIDLVAVTHGPGLIPALLVGVNVARTLSCAYKKPLLGIHHIEGHIYANFIGVNSKTKFPILCLVVSGGHTQLVLMKKHLHYEMVGQTLDDAAGEAFDKVARILGLGYPGGPAIAEAAKFLDSPKSRSYELTLPRPMLNKNNFDFSFSGLKTAVLYETKRNEKLLKDKNYISAVAKEFQQATVDVLVSKTIRAAKKYSAKTILIAGGVSANLELRRQLGEAIEKELGNVSYRIPDLIYSLDNAAMIAAAASFRWQKMSIKEKKAAKENWKGIEASANLSLK
jgi:N6-L-threonylcarbamoyladenine synthase